MQNLKPHINYACSYLSNSLGIRAMEEIAPSETVTTKNVCEASRELKKWQAEKKFKQKKKTLLFVPINIMN